MEGRHATFLRYITRVNHGERYSKTITGFE